MKYLLVLTFLGLCGCYQIDSEEDLRGVPVTNHPNVVPSHGSFSQFTALNP